MVENLSKEPKKEDKLDWLSSVRRDGGADDFKLEGRERIKQAEVEKNNGGQIEMACNNEFYSEINCLGINRTS